MKKVIRFTIACIASGLLLFVVSCNKNQDKIQGDALASAQDLQLLQDSASRCRISFIYDSVNNIQYTFYYDSLGNPLKVLSPYPGTGNANKHFRYDAQKRLSVLYGLYYDSTSFEFYTKYVYDSTSKVIRDTTYNFGTLSGGLPTSYYNWTVTHYSYDAAKRISQTNTLFGGVGSGILKNYAYDSTGNQIRAGITYDNKVNLNRTNKIWQFLNRDYSRNNPFNAGAYNFRGLPFRIYSDGYTNFRYFLNLDLRNAVIGYLCN